MQGTSLKFASQEDAVAFAEKQGWDYFLQAPHKQEFHPKSYSTNFTKTHMNPSKSEFTYSRIRFRRLTMQLRTPSRRQSKCITSEGYQLFMKR